MTNADDFDSIKSIRLIRNTRQSDYTLAVDGYRKDGVPLGTQATVSKTEFFQYWTQVAEEKGIPIVRVDYADSQELRPVFAEHPTFNTPDDSQRIWRYMDFGKFMSLLQTQSLWFARADVLQLTDPMEGRVPQTQIENDARYTRSSQWGRVTDGNGNTLLSPEQVAESNVIMQRRRDYFSRFSKFINCWHISDAENYAMWNIYGKDRNSVAIRSTVGRLKDALGQNRTYNIFIGSIDYVDYEDPSIASEFPENGFKKYLRKSKFYEYESELRLIHWDTGYESDLFSEDVPFYLEPTLEQLALYPKGIQVKVNLQELIDSIVVSPDCEPWFHELLKGLKDGTRGSSIVDVLSKTEIQASAVKDFERQGPPSENW